MGWRGLWGLGRAQSVLHTIHDRETDYADSATTSSMSRTKFRSPLETVPTLARLCQLSCLHTLLAKQPTSLCRQNGHEKPKVKNRVRSPPVSSKRPLNTIVSPGASLPLQVPPTPPCHLQTILDKYQGRQPVTLQYCKTNQKLFAPLEGRGLVGVIALEIAWSACRV